MDVIEKALVFAKECHGGDCSGHDFEHILRVLANVDRILVVESVAADELVVRLATILHDVDDYKLGSDGHRAERFLCENGVEKSVRERVLEVIEAISFSKSGSSPKFKTMEQKIVSDADKLDAMGAIGVCRTVMYSVATGRTLFNAAEFPNEHLTLEEYKNKNRKGNHSINHFFEKLLKLKNAMQTEAGRQEASRRHRFMILFLEEFFVETGAVQWLEYLYKSDNELG